MHNPLEFRRDDRFMSAVPEDAPACPTLLALALLAILSVAVTAAAAAGALTPQDDPAPTASMELTGP